MALQLYLYVSSAAEDKEADSLRCSYVAMATAGALSASGNLVVYRFVICGQL